MAADPEVYKPLEGLERDAKACFVGQRYADRDRWMAELVRADVPLVIYGPGWGGPAAAPEDKNDKQPPPPPPEDLGRPAPPAGSMGSYLQAIKRNIHREGLAGGLTRSVRQIQYRRETRKLAPIFKPFAKGPLPFEKIFQAFGENEVILNFSNVWADGRPGSELIPHVRLRDFEAPMCRTCYVTGHTDEIEEFYEPDKEVVIYKTPEELVDKTKFYLANPDAAEKVREAGFQRARRDHAWTNRFEELFRKIDLKVKRS
jgi:hypothetical protein